MKQIDLIKLAVNEWGRGQLTSEEAILRVAIIINIRKPSKENIWRDVKWKLLKFLKNY